MDGEVREFLGKRVVEVVGERRELVGEGVGPYEEVREYGGYRRRVMPGRQNLIQLLKTKRFDLIPCPEDYPKLTTAQSE
jgi:hypothetical protein